MPIRTDDIDELGARALSAMLARGRLSAVELVEATLSAARSVDPRLKPFVHLLDERALEAARESDRRLRAGSARSLEGLPLTIKDSLWLEGLEAADGSRARAGLVARATDVAVARAEDAGAVIFAKTANPELCLFGYTASELNGASANPWDLSRTPGGSSGGAAAALAAGVGPLALGSDGGGSLRIPAAFCGVAAHKPTFGLVPYWPDVPAWPTLSVIGPLAREVGDLELLLAVIAGPELADPCSSAAPALTHTNTRAQPLPRQGPTRARVRARASSRASTHHTDAAPALAGLRVIADVDRAGAVPIEPAVHETFETVIGELRRAGVSVVAERGPWRESHVREWLTIASSDARAAFGAELAHRAELLGEDTRAFLAWGERLSATELALAERRRIEIAAAYAELFARTEASAILSPALGLEAFGLDTQCPREVAGVPIERPYDDWQGHLWDANLAGLPACVIPMGLGPHGLPLGLQIVGPRLSDWRILALARAIEQMLALNLRPPTL
ncbi:MAG TPA: amidase [Solirubrobacteraceae bacterium]|nr:amidase [Solirubrobacteraceae bacterium]